MSASKKAPISPIDALGIEVMASGHLCLNLTERIGRRDFSSYAKVVALRLEATWQVVAETGEMQIWALSFGDATALLVWSDYPVMVSLESDSDSADEALRRLHAELQTENS
jgi:hypothetical protein